MLKKSLIISLIFIIIALATVIICRSPNAIIINKENKLENKLENKRDSVKEKIDTVFIDLNKNEKHYKEVCNIIDSLSIDSNYIFFSKYIESYSKRLDNFDNK